MSRLVYSMIQFLQSHLEEGTGGGGGLTEEGVESVEVAIQCLETAYGVSLARSELAVSRSLYQIFEDGTRGERVRHQLTFLMKLIMNLLTPLIPFVIIRIFQLFSILA